MTGIPKPNYWILITIVFLFLLIGFGGSSGYLEAWWNSTLQETYPSFPFDKTSKAVKLMQFCVGLLAIFELVAFPTFFRDAKDTFVWTSGFYGLTRNTGSRVFNISKVTLQEYLGKDNESHDIKEIFTRHVMEEVESEMERSEESPFAAALHNLSKINISPQKLKAITFGSFILLTIIDIFTS